MADNSKQIEQMEEELKVDKNSLLGKWRNKAYDQNADKGWLKRFWDSYFQTEKGIYQQLLADPDAEVRGTVKELAEKYAVPVETMDEDTEVSLAFDREKLYKNMVDAKADWLYELPEWNEIFSAERQKELYLEQKKSGTIVKPKKIGRNDPCPCGSGKKYKHCCGR